MDQTIIGKKFGKITVVSFSRKKKKLHYYNCICDCGKEYEIFKSALTRNKNPSRSCGCENKNAFTEKAGKVFNFLTVIKLAYRKNNRIYWTCRCSCGKLTIVSGSNLQTGAVKSCGHIFTKSIQNANSTHGLSKSRTYSIWSGVIKRCTNRNAHAYHRYGGRGITVSKRWLKFENFLQDMGQCPSEKLSLDRINPNRGYYKNNCRWADGFTQAINNSAPPKGKSGYHGVVIKNRSGKIVFESYITHRYKKIYLGTFSKAEDAAIAFNQKAMALRGNMAKLNIIKKAIQPKNYW